MNATHNDSLQQHPEKGITEDTLINHNYCVRGISFQVLCVTDMFSHVCIHA